MIYFENSSKKRLSFFQERLIQHLWGMYRDECADQIRSYLDLVRQQAHGQEKVIKLVKDARLLEEGTGFQVFPS